MTAFFDPADTTLLVVDDESISRLLVRGMLTEAGYRVVESSDGEGCLELVEKVTPDLILLDISLPGMDGIEVCRVLADGSGTRDIPVIFLTGDTTGETLQAAFDAGCADYLRKPTEEIELLVRVKSVLNQRLLRQKLLQEEKLKGVLELAGAVCHELNQPLHAVMGYANLLLVNTQEGDKTYRFARVINEQVERMGEITAKLMGITRYRVKDYLGNLSILDLDGASGELHGAGND